MEHELTEQISDLKSYYLGGTSWDPNYNPGVDLSNEGSNFTLSPLEVGH